MIPLIVLPLVAAGVAVGNFAFQGLESGDWGRAADRTFFQWAALAAVWIGARLSGVRS